LIVLPGDAEVEVNDRAVRRRNGVIELTGKAGDRLRMHVFDGFKDGYAEVTIATDGARPGLLKLGELKSGPVYSESGPGEAAPTRPAAPTADPLLPEEFQ
jgi:hypothetical protein